MAQRIRSGLRLGKYSLLSIFILVFLGFWLKEKTASHPRYTKIFYHLGDDAEAKGRSAQAERYYRKAISLDPAFAPSYHRLGSIYEKRGDLEQARKYYERAVFINSDFPEAFYDLGMMLLKENHDQEAAAYLERSVEGFPYPKFRYGLGLAYIKLGKKEKALDLAQSIKSQGASNLAEDLENAIKNSGKSANVKQ